MKQAPNLIKMTPLWVCGLDVVLASDGIHRWPGGFRGGAYYPARPLGFYSLGNRLRCAWLVFTGRADALIWPPESLDPAP